MFTYSGGPAVDWTADGMLDVAAWILFSLKVPDVDATVLIRHGGQREGEWGPRLGYDGILGVEKGGEAGDGTRHWTQELIYGLFMGVTFLFYTWSWLAGQHS
jgi:hypothetical protein